MRLVLLLSLLVMVLGVLPPQSVHAGITRPLALDNTLDEFSGGNLQRSSLAQLTSTIAQDKPGGVQLSKIGVLRTWVNDPITMVEPLQQMGATVINDRIYIIGGIADRGGNAVRVADVRSIQVDRVRGGLTGEWRSELPLPAAAPSTQAGFTTAIAAISNPAVTSLIVSPTRAYIYVVGGRAAIGIQGLSSFAVRIATVDLATGQIIEWRTQDNARIIPTDEQSLDLVGVGREAASAVSRTALDGRRYVYVLGGKQSIPTSGGNVVEQGSRSSFYAEVGGDGLLYKPGTNGATPGWTFAQAIPVVPPLDPDSKYGLWNSAAVIDFYPTAGVTDQDGQDSVFMIGGLRLDGVPEQFVYRAVFESTGDLSWLDPLVSPGDPVNNYTLQEARNGHGAVGFAGSFYVVGGFPGNDTDPDNAVQTSYVTPDANKQDRVDRELSLPTDSGGGSSNFFKSPAPGQTSGGLRFARANHATVLVKGAGSSQNAAYVFALGGRGGQQLDDPARDGKPSNLIFFGAINTGEDDSFGYASDGWFYSRPFTLFSSEAQLREVTWVTSINRGASGNADVEVDYRTSLASECTRSATWTPWATLDGSPDGFRSKAGTAEPFGAENVVTNVNIRSRCFQYRARLVRGSTISYTPGLLNVGVKIFIPGEIDVWMVPNGSGPTYDAGQRMIDLKVALTNQNQISPAEPTISAAFPPNQPNGQIFVDMQVYYNATTYPTPGNPSIPINEPPPETKAFAMVEKGVLGAGALFNITRWCRYGESTCVTVDPLTFFSQPGRYTVLIIVDSTNLLCEGGEPTAGGNGECPIGGQTGKGNNVGRFQVEVLPGKEPSRGGIMRLPMILR
jgi:hypothetical protein